MYGHRIEFKPTTKTFSFPSADKYRSHWDILEAIAKQGNLTIEGLPYKHWVATRDALLRGENFKICTGGAPVSLVLKNLAFLSGKKLSVVSGDKNQKVNSVEGNGLKDLISKISTQASVSIVQN